jgi:hypothetical protein
MPVVYGRHTQYIVVAQRSAKYALTMMGSVNVSPNKHPKEERECLRSCEAGTSDQPFRGSSTRSTVSCLSSREALAVQDYR